MSGLDLYVALLVCVLCGFAAGYGMRDTRKARAKRARERFNRRVQAAAYKGHRT